MNNNERTNGGVTASSDPHGRSPEEIERDIARTRNEMDETLTAIQRRLSPEMLIDEAVSYIRHGGAAEFMDNLNESVKRNPVPVTLVGIGLAWLMLSGREGQYSPHRASQSHLGERLSGVKERVSGIASAGRERLAHARERGGERGAHLRERISGTGSQLRERASHVAENTRYGAVRARSGFETLMREQPLLLGALGVALGAAVGSLLPPTRKEDELMGEARDRLRDQAKERASQQLDKGKRIAEAASEAAKDEARRQTASREQSGAGRQSPGL